MQSIYVDKLYAGYKKKQVTKYTLKEDLNKIVNQCGCQLFKNEKC